MGAVGALMNRAGAEICPTLPVGVSRFWPAVGQAREERAQGHAGCVGRCAFGRLGGAGRVGEWTFTYALG